MDRLNKCAAWSQNPPYKDNYGLKYTKEQFVEPGHSFHFFLKSALSQWSSKYPIKAYHGNLGAGEVVFYSTAEHYMMGAKALLMKDEESFRRIISVSSPYDAKQLGRQIRNFDQGKWNQFKVKIVKMGNVLRGMQNEEWASILLGTEDKILVEMNPRDNIWGTGLDMEDPLRHRPYLWPGYNMLGFILMEVRDILRHSIKEN